MESLNSEIDSVVKQKGVQMDDEEEKKIQIAVYDDEIEALTKKRGEKTQIKTTTKATLDALKDRQKVLNDCALLIE